MNIYEKIGNKIIASILSGFSEDDINYAVRKNADLVELINKHLPRWQIEFMRSVAKASGASKYYNADNVLLYLNETNKSLADYIMNNSAAKAWFVLNVEKIRRFLFD
jgi:hypothetical protein